MTTSLYSFLLTAGADRMAVTDPHGWTLTIISVTVVFSALIILFCIYGLLGEIFMGTFKRNKKSVAEECIPAVSEDTPDAEVAAAIALALDMYIRDNLHDEEPGVITIEPRDNTNWKFGKR